MRIHAFSNFNYEAQEKRINYISLKFTSNALETHFQQFLSDSSENSFNNKKTLLFIPFHQILLILFLASYLLKLKDSVNESSLKFQLVFITFCIIISLIFVHKKVNFLSKEIAITLLYLSTSVSLILNDFYFQNIAFNESVSASLNCLPGLFAIIIIYAALWRSSFQNLLLINIIISVLFGVVRLIENINTDYGILEIILLILIQIHQVISVYTLELNERQRFLDQNYAMTYESEKILSSETNGNDFRIQNSIQELSSIMPNLPESQRYFVEKAIGLFKNISIDHKYRLSNDVTSIENITKGLDPEDKLYIEQSWTTSNVLYIRKREKAKIKEAIDKIFDKFSDNDLILMLKQIGVNWNLNIFSLNNRSGFFPITLIGKYTFKLYSLIDVFRIPEKKIENFFLGLEKKYKPNPYHNAIHATDILNSALYIINKSFVSMSLSDLEILSIIISHLSHDVGHPGFTNRFLINFRDELAVECNK